MSQKAKPHREVHRSGRSAWLRAAVLGADDGVVSTASLIVGVAASSASKGAVLVAGIAGLVAGALSMAAGEYVSVSSQRDAEQADIQREKSELAANAHHELRELAGIYEQRGVDAKLALRVAEQLSAHDRLAAHMRDELGLEAATLARPWQAAFVSAASFASLGAVPIVALSAAPESFRIGTVIVTGVVSLLALGALGAHLGGASKTRGAIRVASGGGLAMMITAGIGRLLSVVGL